MAQGEVRAGAGVKSEPVRVRRQRVMEDTLQLRQQGRKL